MRFCSIFFIVLAGVRVELGFFLKFLKIGKFLVFFFLGQLFVEFCTVFKLLEVFLETLLHLKGPWTENFNDVRKGERLFFKQLLGEPKKVRI